MAEEKSRLPQEAASLPEEEDPAAAAASRPRSESGASAPARPRHTRPPRDPAVARAYRSGRALPGRVEQVVKGGFEIKLGRVRAFCPFSQMDLRRVERPEEFLGRKEFFRVIRYRRGGEDVVVSRRAVLEEELGEQAKYVRATLREGAVMRGRVVRLVPFGAFVDLGAGVTGLVHVSELAHTRVERPEEAVEVGQWVSVKILRLDDDKGRISLSVRQASPDPWAEVAQRFAPGTEHTGRIVSVSEDGATIELAAGVEAWLGALRLPPRQENRLGGWNPGGEARVRVLEVDIARRCIEVIPAHSDGLAPQLGLEAGASLTGRVERVERSGVVVWLGPAHSGFLPAAWTGLPRGANLHRRFAVGQEVQVEVVEVRRGRIRLALHGVRPVAESAPQERRSASPRDDQQQEEAGTFRNTLADALRAALEERR